MKLSISYQKKKKKKKNKYFCQNKIIDPNVPLTSAEAAFVFSFVTFYFTLSLS